MAKGYIERINDILDKMGSHTDLVIKTLGKVDDIIKRKPEELTNADVERLQNVIIQSTSMLLDYNNKLYGIL